MNDDDDDDDEGRINFSMALSPKTTRTRNNKPPNSPNFNHLTSNLRDTMLQTFYKLNLKPKTILELKAALQQIQDDLPRRLSQHHLNACILVSCKHLKHQI